MSYFRLPDCSILDETFCFPDTTQLLNPVTFLGIFSSLYKMREMETTIKDAWDRCSLGSVCIYVYICQLLTPPVVCALWLCCSSGHSLVSSLHLSRGIHCLSSHLAFRTLPSICKESSRVCSSAWFLPPVLTCPFAEAGREKPGREHRDNKLQRRRLSLIPASSDF